VNTATQSKSQLTAGLYRLLTHCSPMPRRSNFVERLDALRAQGLANHLVPIEHLDMLKVRLEQSLRPVLGVAHVVADPGSFATVLTDCHDPTCFDSIGFKSAE
jgi:hypothetical protein